MGRQRPVLQTFRNIKRAQSILVQNKWRITGNGIQAFCGFIRLVLRSFSLYEARNVYTRPFFRVPPYQFFPFAPRTAVRSRTGTIVNEPAIARPPDTPAVAERAVA